MKILSLATAIACSISFHAGADEGRFWGICDASAAVAIDARHFIVSDDETSTLSIYDWEMPASASPLDLTDFLDNRKANGEAREADLEGAAHIGERIYWLASHSRGKDGDFKKGRQRLFATTVSATGGTAPEGAVFKGLLEALLAEDKFASLDLKTASQKAPKAKGGFNIEALAASPSGELLIGFRSPLIEDDALVIPLRNPAAVIGGSAPPLFGDAARLDLGGRGIRSLEFIGGRYVVVAGPAGEEDTDKDFVLRAWDGPQAGRTTTELATLPKGFNAEALFATPGEAGGRMIVLSDDGEEKVDGRPCKDESTSVEKKSFRWIAIDPR